jgi:hypothetical protein
VRCIPCQGMGSQTILFVALKRGIIVSTDRVTMRTDIRIGSTIAFTEGETKIMQLQRRANGTNEDAYGDRLPTGRHTDLRANRRGCHLAYYITVAGVVAQLGRVAVCEDRTPYDSAQCFHLSSRSREKAHALRAQIQRALKRSGNTSIHYRALLPIQLLQALEGLEPAR